MRTVGAVCVTWARFLHKDRVDVCVRGREDAERVLVLLSVERVAHLLLQRLPLARGRDRVDDEDQDRVEDRLRRVQRRGRGDRG